MKASTRKTDLVETFHGTHDGTFSVTLIDGHIDRLSLPMSAMDPSTASKLGATLTRLLNEALGQHTTDLLDAAAPAGPPADPAADAIERFVERAVAEAEATIAASPSLQRDLAAALAQPEAEEILGHSVDGTVQATLVLGQLRRIEISEHALVSSRPAVVADAVVAAVHDALSRNAVAQQDLLVDLTPEQLARETTELHHRIVELGKEQT